jgi:hypothetical protein
VPAQEPLDDRHAQAHGIDVPGGDRQCHGRVPPAEESSLLPARAGTGKRRLRRAGPGQSDEPESRVETRNRRGILKSAEFRG